MANPIASRPSCAYCNYSLLNLNCDLCLNEGRGFSETVRLFESVLRDIKAAAHMHAKELHLISICDEVQVFKGQLAALEASYHDTKAQRLRGFEAGYFIQLKTFERKLVESLSFTEYSKIKCLMSIFGGARSPSISLIKITDKLTKCKEVMQSQIDKLTSKSDRHKIRCKQRISDLKQQLEIEKTMMQQEYDELKLTNEDLIQKVRQLKSKINYQKLKSISNIEPEHSWSYREDKSNIAEIN